jgi:CRP/FNR family cyclic AMP-dependent transcriptional regulator
MESEGQVLERFARDYPAGTVLFREGETSQEIYVIRSGKVRITKRVRDVEITLVVLSAGDFFGEMATLVGRPRSATARVVDSARLLVIDGATLELMLHANIEIAARMLRKLAERLAEANRHIQTLLMRDHNSRVASFFLNALESYGLETGLVLVDLEEIATQTGCDYSEVSDALERLAHLGLVVSADGGRGYVVRDRDALAGLLELLR